MKLFPVIVKRITTVVTAGGGGSTVARLGVGIATRTRLTWRSSIAAGVAILPRYTLRSRQGAGVALSGRYSGTVRPTQVTGIREVARISNGRLATQRSGAEIVRVQTNLTHRRGGSVIVSNTGWANPSLAIDNTNGIHSATYATSAGSALGSVNTIVLGYPAQTNRTALTISSVKLQLWYATSATFVLSNLEFLYSLNSGTSFTSLGFLPNASSASGALFDIAAAVAGDWTKIAALQTKCIGSMGTASAGETIFLDAVEVEVVANNTLLT